MEGKKINTLNGRQVAQMARWLEGNFARLNGKHRRDIAADASAELGFPVTENNVAKTAADYDLEFKRPVPTPASPAYKMSRNRLLALHVKYLYDLLNLEVPDGLADLARGRRLETCEQLSLESNP